MHTFRFPHLKKMLHEHHIHVTVDDHTWHFSHDHKTYTLHTDGDSTPLISEYFLAHQPEKILSLVQNGLGLNKRVFARNCKCERISRKVADSFFNKYHLLGTASAAYFYGLIRDTELLAAAAFSKGRKMHRLPEDKRSYEMVRFCTRSGYTVSGGLTKLLKSFEREFHPGDIMTYVDAGWSSANSFTNAGFRKVGVTPPIRFLIDPAAGARIAWDGHAPFDESKYCEVFSPGNHKLVKTC